MDNILFATSSLTGSTTEYFLTSSTLNYLNFRTQFELTLFGFLFFIIFLEFIIRMFKK